MAPEEWNLRTCRTGRMVRTKLQHQAVTLLDYLPEQHYISYSRLGKSNLIKFTIGNWKQHNTALDYNYHCLPDGFFFFPIASAHELINIEEYLDMDIVLNL